jgi:hypothetical protein
MVKRSTTALRCTDRVPETGDSTGTDGDAVHSRLTTALSCTDRVPETGDSAGTDGEAVHDPQSTDHSTQMLCGDGGEAVHGPQSTDHGALSNQIPGHQKWSECV